MPRLPCIVLTLVAVAVAVASYVLGDPPLIGDANQNATMGMLLAQRGLGTYTDDYRPYLQPLLIAWLAVLTGPDAYRLHTAFFLTNLAAHVAACWLLAGRLGDVFGSRTAGTIAYALAVLNPFLLISSGEMLRESLSSSVIATAVALTFGSDGGRGVRPTRLFGSFFLAGVATMLRPTSLPIVVAVPSLWAVRNLIWRDVPRHGWLMGVLGLVLPFVPQTGLNLVHHGRLSPLIEQTGIYWVDITWGLTVLKHAGLYQPGTQLVGMSYLNPLAPDGVESPVEFLLTAPLRFFATQGLHLFGLVDLHFPYVFIRDLDPWYRWPLSLVNYAYLWLWCAGLWAAFANRRDTSCRRRRFSVWGSAASAMAYASVFVPVIAESRYGLPIFLLLVPAQTLAITTLAPFVWAAKWRRLAPTVATFVVFVGCCALLSSWMQDQATRLRIRHDATAFLPWPRAAIGVDPPTTWMPGESRTYAVTVANNSTLPWLSIGEYRTALGVHFGPLLNMGQLGAASVQVIPLPRLQPPETTQTLTITVTAPDQPGCYYLYHGMFGRMNSWIETVQYAPVLVGELPPGTPTVDDRTGQGPCRPE